MTGGYALLTDSRCLDDLNALQPSRDHQVSEAGLGLLHAEADPAPWAAEPGWRN
jgi:hypothetical protein